MYSQTIAAVSTPYGRGAVSMIRISGDEAIEIADKVFKARSGKTLADTKSSRSIYGDIYYNNEAIDDCLATVFRAPHSYTGEDTVEIYCHGGIYVTSEVLSATLSAGARAAEAGEFSKRAFINGKLTLSQAEAVINTIDAKSHDSLMLARSHHDGIFSKEIEKIYKSLLDIESSVYAYADYPDEDLTDMSADEMKSELGKIKSELERLLDTYSTGKAISEGIYTVIAGKPNTGKSSLLNMILGKDRAIVTSTEGTTRDRIEEDTNLGRVRIRLSDTAGVRKSDDAIENIGIEKTFEAINSADLILALFDASESPDERDKEFIETLSKMKTAKIAVMNKTDISSVWKPEGFDAVVEISAKDHKGLDKLTCEVEKLFINEKIDYKKDAVIANARQHTALSKAFSSVCLAYDSLKDGFTPDVCGLDVEDAMASLGECDGRSVSQDIADAIFSRFCVGK